MTNKIRLSVLLPLALDQSYDYISTKKLALGQFVRVPIRNKISTGVVWDLNGSSSIPDHKLRKVIEILNLPPMNQQQRNFIDWVADYTMAPKGLVLKLAMTPSSLFKKKTQPASIQKPQKRKQEKIMIHSPQLTKTQQQSVQPIHAAIEKGGFSNLLLDGVTGSGKTEIYFNAMVKVLEKGQQVLLLLPEIALTIYMLERFEHYADMPAAVWHSGLRASLRHRLWLDIATGKTKIIIGARSALFLSFSDLGLIVVDEEHDEGFKQEDGVIYHARDMAIARASLSGFPIVLSSATPCLETLANVRRGKSTHIMLTKRVRPLAVLPQIHLIDLRKQKQKKQKWIDPELAKAVQKALSNHAQALLFLNRRGYAPLTLCRHCGFRFSCPDCDAWLTEHRKLQKFLCHHCGLEQKHSQQCPQCHQKDSFVPCGPGIERIFEEAKQIFPEARIACLSRDLPEKIKDRLVILNAMENHQLDILIGTQIIAKGLHFPHLTVAGIIDADIGLANADLRAGERSFQLLQQVAGRTGRDVMPGHAFLQTYMPDHPVMSALVQNDRQAFLQQETENRKRGSWPPYGRLAAIILSSENQVKLNEFAHSFARVAPKHRHMRILGPAPAPIFRRKRRYHVRFLAKASRQISLQSYLRQWLDAAPPLPHAVRRQIDIDPHSFL